MFARRTNRHKDRRIFRKTAQHGYVKKSGHSRRRGGFRI